MAPKVPNRRLWGLCGGFEGGVLEGCEPSGFVEELLFQRGEDRVLPDQLHRLLRQAGRTDGMSWPDRQLQALQPRVREVDHVSHPPELRVVRG